MGSGLYDLVSRALNGTIFKRWRYEALWVLWFTLIMTVSCKEQFFLSEGESIRTFTRNISILLSPFPSIPVLSAQHRLHNLMLLNDERTIESIEQLMSGPRFHSARDSHAHTESEEIPTSLRRALPLWLRQSSCSPYLNAFNEIPRALSMEVREFTITSLLLKTSYSPAKKSGLNSP